LLTSNLMVSPAATGSVTLVSCPTASEPPNDRAPPEDGQIWVPYG
jgi:hypothetical protein